MRTPATFIDLTHRPPTLSQIFVSAAPMSFRLRCNRCTLLFWNVPGNGSGDYVGNYCHECTILSVRRIYQSRLAKLARSNSPWHLNTYEIATFGAGSLHPLAIQRAHRRAALYVVLVSPGPFRQKFTGSDTWDRSDNGPINYRRDLLEKIITYLI